MTTHKLTKVTRTDRQEPRYEYRGILIQRDSSLRRYWGHWSTVFRLSENGGRERAATRTYLLRLLDQHLDGK